jgi:DNA-binding transcriptional LysR family regulator
MVEAGLGVGILPKTSAAGPQRGIIFRPLAEPWALREINICCRDPSYLSATTMKLLDHLIHDAGGSL